MTNLKLIYAVLKKCLLLIVIANSNSKIFSLFLLSHLLLCVDFSLPLFFLLTSTKPLILALILGSFLLFRIFIGNLFNSIFADISFSVSLYLSDVIGFTQTRENPLKSNESIRILNAIYTTFVANSIFPSLLFAIDIIPIVICICIPAYILISSMSFDLNFLGPRIFFVTFALIIVFSIVKSLRPKGDASTIKASSLSSIGSLLANLSYSLQDIKVFGLEEYLTNQIRHYAHKASASSREIYRSSQISSLVVQSVILVIVYSGFNFLTLSIYTPLQIGIITICMAKLFYYFNRLLSASNSMYANIRDNNEILTLLNPSLLHKNSELPPLNPQSFANVDIAKRCSYFIDLFGLTDANPLQLGFQGSSVSVLKVIGPSGSGKTTYLKLLAHDLMSRDGYYALPSRDLCFNYRQLVAISFQQNCWVDGNVLENISLFGSNDIDYSIINSLFTSDELNSGILYKQLSSLGSDYCEISGGQASRCGTARAILTRRPILILDEPFASLDSLSIERVKSILNSISSHTFIIYTDHTQTMISQTQHELDVRNIFDFKRAKIKDI